MEPIKILLMFLKLHKTSNFGVFAVDAKPPILELFAYYTKNLRFWSIKILLMFLKLRKTSNFGAFAVGAKPPILEFL